MVKTNTPSVKKTTTREIKQGKAAPVIETVTEIVEEIKDELNEPVETFTVRKSWLIVAAVVVTVMTIAFIL